MRYLLDTNILSDLVRNPQGIIAQKIRAVGEDSVWTSIVVAAELRYGALKKRSSKLTHHVELILGAIAILPLEAPTDAAYAKLRLSLESAGKQIGGNDLLIAAHAISLQSTLVTDNVSEFGRISSLRLENWLRP